MKFNLLLAGLFVAAGCVAPINEPRGSSVTYDACETHTCVTVKDATHPYSPEGARVFVLSDRGEIASSRTDSSGVALLPLLGAESGPKFILVEAEGYFVSGTRWSAGLRDYYIIITPFALR